MPNILALQTLKMQFYSVMQSFISYIQEKFNSIVCKVHWFLCLCWYQNDESQSQLDDSGAKTLPLGCICADEHTDKQIKERMQLNKQITRRSPFSYLLIQASPVKFTSRETKHSREYLQCN